MPYGDIVFYISTGILLVAFFLQSGELGPGRSAIGSGAEPVIDGGLMDTVFLGGVSHGNTVFFDSFDDIRLYISSDTMASLVHTTQRLWGVMPPSLYIDFVSKIRGPGQ